MSEEGQKGAFMRFFAVIFRSQTYRDMAYLLLSFPMGLIYFIWMVVGIVLSIGLIPIFIGFPLLLIVMKSFNGIVAYEQALSRHMIGCAIPAFEKIDQGNNERAGLFQAIGREFMGGRIFQNIVFILHKFIMGIVSFVLVVTLFAVSLGLITLPVVHRVLLKAIDVDILEFESSIWSLLGMNLSVGQQYIVYVILGVLFMVVSMHAMRLLIQLQHSMLAAFNDNTEKYKPAL